MARDGPSQAHVVLSATCHQQNNRALGTGPESIAKPEMRPEGAGMSGRGFRFPGIPRLCEGGAWLF